MPRQVILTDPHQHRRGVRAADDWVGDFMATEFGSDPASILGPEPPPTTPTPAPDPGFDVVASFLDARAQTRRDEAASYSRRASGPNPLPFNGLGG